MMNMRKIIKPFKWCGLKVRKGDIIAAFILGSNFRPDFYPKRDSFNPDRYLSTPENNMTVNDVKYPKVPRVMNLSFGGGSRGCLGKYLAYMLVKCAVSEFIKTFKFSPISEDYKMVYKF